MGAVWASAFFTPQGTPEACLRCDIADGPCRPPPLAYWVLSVRPKGGYEGKKKFVYLKWALCSKFHFSQELIFFWFWVTWPEWVGPPDHPPSLVDKHIRVFMSAHERLHQLIRDGLLGSIRLLTFALHPFCAPAVHALSHASHSGHLVLVCYL